MHHDGQVYARYVMVGPCEVILVFSQELDQICPERLAQELSNFESPPRLIWTKLNLF